MSSYVVSCAKKNRTIPGVLHRRIQGEAVQVVASPFLNQDNFLNNNYNQVFFKVTTVNFLYLY